MTSCDPLASWSFSFSYSVLPYRVCALKFKFTVAVVVVVVTVSAGRHASIENIGGIQIMILLNAQNRRLGRLHMWLTTRLRERTQYQCAK